jgi:hypothetical protein
MKTQALIKTVLISTLAYAIFNSVFSYAATKNVPTKSLTIEINYIKTLPAIAKPLTTLKQQQNFHLVTNIELTAMSDTQETLYKVNNASTGNKLFELATQANDKLQLFIAKFKKMFLTKTNTINNQVTSPTLTSSKACALNNLNSA